MSSHGTGSSSDITAVILAAGRGTRMGKITENLPKPLVPVLGRPALYWVLDGLIEAQVSRFVIVTGYHSGMVRDAVEQYLKVTPARVDFVQQTEQKGTAHAMGLTRNAAGDGPVMLAYADIITSPENYSAMTREFNAGHCDMTAAVRDAGDPYRAAAVYVDSEFRIEKIIEKPPVGASTTPWSHAGMYCFSNSIYNYIERVTPSSRGELEITDAVQMMLDDQLNCRAVEFAGYWKDLATPEDVRIAESMILSANQVDV